jgi:hypothetical protein
MSTDSQGPFKNDKKSILRTRQQKIKERISVHQNEIFIPPLVIMATLTCFPAKDVTVAASELILMIDIYI